uniref:Uncharacterized protein n=1 Tax=Aegilops tauschii subsp. strangulata TaxID=200361 RepID=A0A453Q588_AEGTS
MERCWLATTHLTQLVAAAGKKKGKGDGVAVGLARHGCRLVLVGDEGALAATVEEARRSAAAVKFRGMEADIKFVLDDYREDIGKVTIYIFLVSVVCFVF